MDNCMIRPAAMKDYETVEAIMKQVHAMHVSWRPDVYCMPKTVLPAAMFEQAVSEERLLVAEVGGQVIGLLLFFVRHVEGNGKTTHDMLWADAIGVAEGFRGCGVGHMLLDRLQEIAVERGVGSIGLGVSASNERARRMYEAYGFAERTINMEMKIQQTSGSC